MADRNTLSRPASRLAVLLVAALALAATAVGARPAVARTVHYNGHTLSVPRGWPVYRLSAHPRMCVRLDRRAVYLGTPSSNQRCPADAIGRRRAVVVDPNQGARARASSTGGATSFSQTSTAAAFTGLGFDACATPSSRTMAAWGASPYRAIGVYIGGSNRACSQPNLTSTWVGEQISNGWHLIPTYVGLQAPTSSCSSCAKLSTAAAGAQGTAAASDAVEQAQLVGIGPGSPIYFDMEAYTTTTSATNATLTFLAAWTTRLHALGYVSGVYSSSSSGIAALAAAYGTGYTEPDDIWIANWNGRQNTSDPAVSSSYWAQHQRLHQYAGAHNETYGGVTINIDNDYVEGATAGTFESASDPKGALSLAGSPRPGWVRVAGWAFDPEASTEPLSITVYVGGRAGEPSAVPYELGPIASQPRPDIAESHTSAGPNHGFDTTFSTWKSGRQAVCVYAGNIGGGSDKLLGCRTIAVPVGIVLSNLHSTRRGVRVRARCEWPSGTECPGQFIVRAKVRVRVPRHGRRGPSTRVRRLALARRHFTLSGERAHGFLIPLNSRGRYLLRSRPRLWSQLVTFIPGGHVSAAVELRHR